jgi:hypothetical protein
MYIKFESQEGSSLREEQLSAFHEEVALHRFMSKSSSTS